MDRKHVKWLVSIVFYVSCFLIGWTGGNDWFILAILFSFIAGYSFCLSDTLRYKWVSEDQIDFLTKTITRSRSNE